MENNITESGEDRGSKIDKLHTELAEINTTLEPLFVMWEELMRDHKAMMRGLKNASNEDKEVLRERVRELEDKIENDPEVLRMETINSKRRKIEREIKSLQNNS
jgi:hypothetical protein